MLLQCVMRGLLLIGLVVKGCSLEPGHQDLNQIFAPLFISYEPSGSHQGVILTPRGYL